MILFSKSWAEDSGSKEDLEQKIIAKGGSCSKGVSSKVNYLIVGDGGSDAWKFGIMVEKYKKLWN